MDCYMWHRSFVKVEELQRYLRFWLIAERVPVSMRKTKQQWMCGDLVGKHVPEYADSRQSALQINVCQRSALEIRPESESAKSQIEVSRPYVHSKRSDRLFLFCRRPCWLLIVHCAHCPHSERFKSGSEVTWRSWSPDSQVFLRKLSPLTWDLYLSIAKYCLILKHSVQPVPFGGRQFSGCLQIQKRKFQSFKVLRFQSFMAKASISWFSLVVLPYLNIG